MVQLIGSVFHPQATHRVTGEVGDRELVGNLLAILFAAPSIISDDIRIRYAVEVLGRAPGVYEDFYAITAAERRSEHPVVAAITEGARRELNFDG